MKEKLTPAVTVGIFLLLGTISTSAQSTRLSSALPAGGSNWMVMGAIILVVVSYLLYVYMKKRRSRV